MSENDTPVVTGAAREAASKHLGYDTEADLAYWGNVSAHRDVERLAQAFARFEAQILARQAPSGAAGEPFGYWVEQKHAEPMMLRKPAYIPVPSEFRVITPLYTHSASPTISNEQDKNLAQEWFDLVGWSQGGAFERDLIDLFARSRSFAEGRYK